VTDSSQSRGDTERVQEDWCDRCGSLGEHRVGIAANYEGAHINWRALCNDCLRELGEWFRGVETEYEQPGDNHSVDAGTDQEGPQ